MINFNNIINLIMFITVIYLISYVHTQDLEIIENNKIIQLNQIHNNNNFIIIDKNFKGNTVRFKNLEDRYLSEKKEDLRSMLSDSEELSDEDIEFLLEFDTQYKVHKKEMIVLDKQLEEDKKHYIDKRKKD